MYNHVLPHIQPRTTHPPSYIRGGSRAPFPPKNKKFIKPIVFKLGSSNPTCLVMYYPSFIPQKRSPLRPPGVDLGGLLPLCGKNSLTTCNEVFDSKHYMHSHVQPLFYPV